MGNVVGAISREVVRKARRFNVESRTDKFIEKNVKNPPPKPQATLREIDKLNQEMPNLMDDIMKPNDMLLGHLKNVYVSASDPPLDVKGIPTNPKRPLPVERISSELPFGYVEPESVSPGYLSLQQALALLSKYQQDKKKSNIETLAKEYNLSEEDVGNIVENFKIYTLIEEKESSVMKDALLEGAHNDVDLTIISGPHRMQSFQDVVEERYKKEKEDSQKKLE